MAHIRHTYIVHLLAASTSAIMALMGVVSCSRGVGDEPLRAQHTSGRVEQTAPHAAGRLAIDENRERTGDTHAAHAGAAASTDDVAAKSRAFACMLGDANTESSRVDCAITGIINAVTNGLMDANTALDAFIPLPYSPSNAILLCDALLTAASMSGNNTANVVSIKAMALAALGYHEHARDLCVQTAQAMAGGSAYATFTLFSAAGDICSKAGFPAQERLRYYEHARAYADPRVHPGSQLENFGAASSDMAACLLALERYDEACAVLDDTLSTLPTSISWYARLQRLRVSAAHRKASDTRHHPSSLSQHCGQ